MSRLNSVRSSVGDFGVGWSVRSFFKSRISHCLKMGSVNNLVTHWATVAVVRPFSHSMFCDGK